MSDAKCSSPKWNDDSPLSPSASMDTMVDGGEQHHWTTSPRGEQFGADPEVQGSLLGTMDGGALPAAIPPEHPFRTLVLCFDGTGDQFDADNSNIVQFFSMLKKDDRHQQMVYYQAGIGTYVKPQVATPGMAKLSKTLDEMIAWCLDAHVMDGYEFLMQNYAAGDRICIFGFSRGAYTARALAGMIHKVGLLPACNHQQVPFAYKMYTRPDEIGWMQSNSFKRAFSVDVDIEFLGVWDTVNSVGLIPRRLPFTTSNNIVRTFRHAIALDERRAKFKPNLYNRQNEFEAEANERTIKQSMALEAEAAKHGEFLCMIDGAFREGDPHGGVNVSKGSLLALKAGMMRSPEHRTKHEELIRRYVKRKDAPTDVEEVWFAGCHCDVGGGSVGNSTPNALARIPLRWMIRECFRTNSGIMFETDRFNEVGLDPTMLYPFVLPRPPPTPVGNNKIRPIPENSYERVKADYDVPPKVAGTEEEEELKDALSPVYDQLELAPGWWILECVPTRGQKYAKEDDGWDTFGINFGRGRFIPRQKTDGLKVHRSVKMRMEAEYEDRPGVRYVPRARFAVEPTWVE